MHDFGSAAFGKDNGRWERQLVRASWQREGHPRSVADRLRVLYIVNSDDSQLGLDTPVTHSTVYTHGVVTHISVHLYSVVTQSSVYLYISVILYTPVHLSMYNISGPF